MHAPPTIPPGITASIVPRPSSSECAFLSRTSIITSSSPRLSRRSLHLARRTFRSLLAHDTTSGLVSSSLRLLGLLLALSSSLLLLGVLDGLLTGGGACFGSLCAAFLDHIERCADNGSLVLDGATGAFLGDFLYSDTCQVLPSNLADRLFFF
jgi:hypothetical protein